MQASKEIKNWINKERSYHSKIPASKLRKPKRKNGVVKWLWEDFRMERKDANSKHDYKRHKEKFNPGKERLEEIASSCEECLLRGDSKGNEW